MSDSRKAYEIIKRLCKACPTTPDTIWEYTHILNAGEYRLQWGLDGRAFRALLYKGNKEIFDYLSDDADNSTIMKAISQEDFEVLSGLSQHAENERSAS